MRTIETIVNVDEQGMATLKMPPEVAPGEHKIVVMIDEELPNRAKEPMSFPQHDIGPWPFGPNETFRREDLYGDDGR